MNTEVQDKDKSQTENGNGTENAEEETFVIKSDMTTQELQDALGSDSQKRDEYLEIGHDSFLEKYRESEAKDDEVEPKPDEVVKEEHTEAVRAEEELHEMRDTVVPGLRTEITAAKESNEALRAEVKALREAKKEPPKKKDKLPEIIIPEITVPEIGDVDMFEEEGRKKVLDTFETMRKQLSDTAGVLGQFKRQNEALHAEVEELRTTATTTKESVEETNAKLDSETLAANVKKQVDSQLKEIDTLRQSEKGTAVFGEYTRTTKNIEDDYLAFVAELAKAARIEGNVNRNDGSGRFTDRVERAMALYADPKSSIGADLRKNCSKKPPDDMATLDLIYDVHSFRNSHTEVRDGKTVPISYEDALEFYAAKNPKIAEKMAIQKGKTNRTKHEKAVANRQAAVEAPVKSEQANAMSPEAEFMEADRILKKVNVDRTKEEKEMARRVLLTMKDGLPKEEVDMLVPLEE